MAAAEKTVMFSARLYRPVETNGDESWAFCDLPDDVSEMLPSRGQVAATVEINGVSRLLVMQPNGTGGHWMKVDAELQSATGASIGQQLDISLTPSKSWPDPDVPIDFAKQLEANGAADSTWNVITTAAKTDWIFWMESAKKSETRQKRIEATCDMLANGKRRVCCFDRSGMYSNSIKGPVARE